jgi:hypothetical protein
MPASCLQPNIQPYTHTYTHTHTLSRAHTWMKFSWHQGLLNLLAFQASYTASSVMWSPSGWKNLARFWSACVAVGVAAVAWGSRCACGGAQSAHA